MKKSLSSVCWAWRDVGIQSLYRDVVIRRVGQVPALFDTLRNPNATYDLAGFIQHITVACYVPKICQQVFQHDMKEILSLCRSLKHLNVDIFGDTLDVEAQTLGWNPIPSNITSHVFGDNINLQATSPLLALCASSIQSLSIAKISADPPIIALELPQLRRLEFKGCASITSELWEMPKLDALQLNVRVRPLDWSPFFEVHGHKLVKFAMLYNTPHNTPPCKIWPDIALN
ncbi:hypothetical protein AX16_003986 [Volvariella volvacea WC 439]|nr:hypothetical protein AX16_003986 [Volvariella volvacea WC 439]